MATFLAARAENHIGVTHMELLKSMYGTYWLYFLKFDALLHFISHSSDKKNESAEQ